MSILTLSLVSHFAAFHFKPLNITWPRSNTQTAEMVAKMKQEQIQMVFRRQA